MNSNDNVREVNKLIIKISDNIKLLATLRDSTRRQNILGEISEYVKDGNTELHEFNRGIEMLPIAERAQCRATYMTLSDKLKALMAEATTLARNSDNADLFDESQNENETTQLLNGKTIVKGEYKKGDANINQINMESAYVNKKIAGQQQKLDKLSNVVADIHANAVEIVDINDALNSDLDASSQKIKNIKVKGQHAGANFETGGRIANIMACSERKHTVFMIILLSIAGAGMIFCILWKTTKHFGTKD